jgi:hypothetical protein
LELADRIGYAPPNGCAGVIADSRTLIRSFGALSARLLTVSLEHYHGGAPGVDFRYHTGGIGAVAFFVDAVIGLVVTNLHGR